MAIARMASRAARSRWTFAGAKLYGNASVEVGGETTRFENLPGVRQLTVLLPAGMGSRTTARCRSPCARGSGRSNESVTVPPKRQWTVFVYPHSHVDIGYTEPQDVVEKIHMRNMNVGLELGQATAGYPEGARHVWNNEVLWAVESWIKQASPAEKQELRRRPSGKAGSASAPPT